VSALAFLLLAVASAVLVLFVFPGAFEIESMCVSASGTQSSRGDTYIAGFAVAGMFGWLAVLMGMVFANIADRRDIALLLPLVWAASLVLAAFVVAIWLGPEPCPS
jgi:hypothetical protein